MQPEPLAAATSRKSEQTRERAEQALRDLDARGEPINFQAVAQAASVSRQWLYTQPELRSEIERRRADSPAARSISVAPRERATEASLRQRVETLVAENRRLRSEVAQLKDELALAYGQRREAD